MHILTHSQTRTHSHTYSACAGKIATRAKRATDIVVSVACACREAIVAVTIRKKNIRNRIQCALSSETQYRRYRFSLYFHFGAEAASISHYYLTYVFASYIVFLLFCCCSSHIRSFVQFNLVVATFIGIGRRTK